jgi:hypothetical protein
MFLRSGWSIVRSASLAKGGTSKKRLSPQLHNIWTQSNKVNPQTSQTALVKTKVVPMPNNHAMDSMREKRENFMHSLPKN